MNKTPILIAILSGLALAAGSGDRFDVASIHPSDPNPIGVFVKYLPGGGLSITGMTIRNLIWLAWQLPPERVVDGPKWLESEKYDIQAKPEVAASLSNDAEMARVQALLTDRFQLKVHRETKDAPVYILTIAKTGLRMHAAGGPDPAADGKGSITPWKFFVFDLSQRLHRPVIDKTDLAGAWYVKLNYTTDDGTPSGIGIRIDPLHPPSDPGPSIFTAVQEQLGLKLDSAKGPIDMLVIDSIERPTPN